MVARRTLTHVMAVGGIAACLAGCGQVGEGRNYPGAAQHTQTIPNQSAPPLAAGVDPLVALEQRPMRPPSPSTDGTCVASESVDLKDIAPNYGAGAGPVYVAGQAAWYSAGEETMLMVDSRYSGPLLVRPFQLGGDGKSTLTLAEFEGNLRANDDKERSHGVGLVPGLHPPTGGLYLPAAAPSSLWRAWLGRMSTSAAGCFGLQIDGKTFTEFIVILVNPGNPPPG